MPRLDALQLTERKSGGKDNAGDEEGDSRVKVEGPSTLAANDQYFDR